MRILVLGGTAFLGRHFVQLALEAGHDVTYVHRGTTNSGLFPQATEVLLDRKENIESLTGEFDAVFDTCGYHPRDVRRSAKALAGRVGQYVFVSTVSVYADMSEPMVSELNSVQQLEEPESADVSNETYGALKAHCEEEVQTHFDGIVTVVRPGLIVGPHDPTDRFTYWPARIAKGGRILAPGSPERNVQFVDARDLAAWCLRLVDQRIAGVYHVAGHQQLSMREFLNACSAQLSSNADFHWVSDEELLQHEVGPWMEMPLWIPEQAGPFYGMMKIDVSKAQKAGFHARPIEQTIRDTQVWYEGRGRKELSTGLSEEKEQHILDSVV